MRKDGRSHGWKQVSAKTLFKVDEEVLQDVSRHTSLQDSSDVDSQYSLPVLNIYGIWRNRSCFHRSGSTLIQLFAIHLVPSVTKQPPCKEYGSRFPAQPAEDQEPMSYSSEKPSFWCNDCYLIAQSTVSKKCNASLIMWINWFQGGLITFLIWQEIVPEDSSALHRFYTQISLIALSTSVS